MGQVTATENVKKTRTGRTGQRLGREHATHNIQRDTTQYGSYAITHRPAATANSIKCRSNIGVYNYSNTTSISYPRSVLNYDYITIYQKAGTHRPNSMPNAGVRISARRDSYQVKNK